MLFVQSIQKRMNSCIFIQLHRNHAVSLHVYACITLCTVAIAIFIYNYNYIVTIILCSILILSMKVWVS